MIECKDTNSEYKNDLLNHLIEKKDFDKNSSSSEEILETQENDRKSQNSELEQIEKSNQNNNNEEMIKIDNNNEILKSNNKINNQCDNINKECQNGNLEKKINFGDKNLNKNEVGKKEQTYQILEEKVEIKSDYEQKDSSEIKLENTNDNKDFKEEIVNKIISINSEEKIVLKNNKKDYLFEVENTIKKEEIKNSNNTSCEEEKILKKENKENIDVKLEIKNSFKNLGEKIDNENNKEKIINSSENNEENLNKTNDKNGGNILNQMEKKEKNQEEEIKKVDNKNDNNILNLGSAPQKKFSKKLYYKISFIPVPYNPKNPIFNIFGKNISLIFVNKNIIKKTKLKIPSLYIPEYNKNVKDGLQKIYPNKFIDLQNSNILKFINHFLNEIEVFIGENQIINKNKGLFTGILKYILFSFYQNLEKQFKNKIVFISNKDENKIKKKNRLELINEISLVFLGKEKISNLKKESFKIQIPKKKKIYKVKNLINFQFYPKEEEDFDQFSFLSKVKPKGLRNLGSCCYMNATLQCFFHIKEFTTYFLKNKKEIKRKEGLITNGLLDLFEGLSSKNNNSYYIPRLFKENLIEVDDLFGGGGGKDSGDLVEIILTNCQQELGEDSDFPDFSIDRREERLMYLDLYYKNSQAPSIIMDLFNFETRLTSTCYQCGVKTYNISSENVLLFDLEGIYKYIYKKDNGGFFYSKRRLSVDNCLISFSFNGSLRENVNCKYCNKNTTFLSIRSFVTLPKILIMIMSRGEGEKFECDIDFNEELDLEDNYYGIKGINKENTKYSLLAGTILYGSRGYGHTVAFCKHFDGKYYIFNDSSVSKTCFDEIKRQKVYLLFYQKK